ncbi:DUF4231 domain-containing protein [Macrococcoides bohemicum]|uniref:DUF4231 domain-containing protein n=1 Tax=Macrococcoides bohemicum TaxID=1903056 RepID=UPI001404D1AB|nr:DUF4231 domain-containing protein [Macrococcus bohemicus]
MDIYQYIEERLNEQINWYDKKSTSHKRRYMICKIIAIICTSAIPLIAITELPYFKFFAILLSGIIGISESINWLNNDHTNWIKYRKTCESLKHEYYAFSTLTGVYKNEEHPGKLLVQRAESIISDENVNWANIQNDYQVEKKEVIS